MSKLKILVFEPSKKGYVREIENTLLSMQEIVGGIIEIVYLKNGLCLIRNSQGALLELPRYRGIYGTFFITGNNRETLVSITNIQIYQAKKLYENRRNYEGYSKYLSDFFNEKDLEYKQFNYTIGNTFTVVDNITVINEIMTWQDKDILAMIEETIQYIDFHNDNINDFLQYIGRLLVEHKTKATCGAL